MTRSDASLQRRAAAVILAGSVVLGASCSAPDSAPSTATASKLEVTYYYLPG